VNILVDTSAFLVLVDADNAEQARAAQAVDQIRARRWSLVTQEYVVLETIALLQRRIGPTAVEQFVTELLAAVEVIWIDSETHLTARTAMLATGRKRLSLVDWTSFVVMRRLGITKAFTFDSDFAAQGFEVLPAPL